MYLYKDHSIDNYNFFPSTLNKGYFRIIWYKVFIALGLLLLLASCASVSKHDIKIVETASKQIGAPYAYGGTNPTTGFDCSGLVYFTYKKLDETVPRDTTNLYKNSRHVFLRKKAGDLVFFDTNKKWWHIFNHPDHVGVYVGNGFMIHAPRTGKEVELINFSHNSYWKSRYLNTRRITKRVTNNANNSNKEGKTNSVNS
ncbi:NlpC/P60 family protein [Candidatus Hepatincola sp. Av]